jgi:hypothetical protein
MNIEQKMEYIRRALELGANVDISFHNVSTKKEAKRIAVELSNMAGLKHKQTTHDGTHWYKIRNDDYTFGTSVFYDEFLEEDVDLSGMKEGENIA